jgi:signal transduction histidine kinase
MLFHVTNAIAFAECAALAALLVAWADKVAGAWLLTLFLAGVCFWIAGNELPSWFGPHAAGLALLMLSTAPLGSAIFFNFAATFSRFKLPKWAAYGTLAFGAAVGLAADMIGPGEFRVIQGLGYVAFPNAAGWAATLVWAAFAVAGHAALLRAWFLQGARQRQQIVAIGVSSAVGLFCMSGYGITVLHLPLLPLPLALLPAYPVILVYGILRYRVFVANAWAQRALAWSLLTILAVFVIALVAILPLGGAGIARFVSGGLIAVASLALAGPARALAGRLVYPGGIAGADDVLHWRQELRKAEGFSDLADRAQKILSRRLAIPVRVVVEEIAPAKGDPALSCRAEPDGWHTDLTGWDAAPPGPRKLAELFGTVLADEAERLARAATLAERERERQTQARLAELGALAATVAHDVRNPLNIIRMAAAGVAPEMRAEITEQVSRITRLTADLLDYAKPWTVAAQDFDAAAMLREIASRYAGVELGPGMDNSIIVHADRHRIEQAVANVLDNAAQARARILLDIEKAEMATVIIIADDGPGIPEDIRARIFEPFVSRSPDGTGLGLAIVARVMATHGGTVALMARPGWTTCFTLRLPS